MKSTFTNLKHWIFPPQPAIYKAVPSAPKLIMTSGCLTGLADCLRPEKEKRHEGIAYLVGQTDGKTTLVASAVRPEAHTTAGSFHVTTQAMAKVVRAACDTGLKVVGQVHTHPGPAYHSDGDVEGARIVYPGYISIVLPEYGRHMPSFTGAAVYFYLSHDAGFIELNPNGITVLQEKL